MPLILNIETATDICSIALAEGKELLAMEESAETYKHASNITILLDRCMKKAGKKLADLDALALSSGPGSYTALRVGASTAKGICYALDIPLIAVDTLQSLALASLGQAPGEESLLCPMIDARRMEVYTALFNTGLKKIKPLQALIVEKNSFDAFFEKGISLVFSGNGAPKCKAVLRDERAVFSPQICSARHLIPLSAEAFSHKRFVDAAHYSPNYFKAPNITRPKKIL